MFGVVSCVQRYDDDHNSLSAFQRVKTWGLVLRNGMLAYACSATANW